MKFTGERYVPELDSAQISYEHWHRYLLAASLVTGKAVLDIASGEGYGSSLLAATASRVVGVDSDAAAVTHASARYKSENLEFLHGSVEMIPLQGENVFDFVVSFETIEHVEECQQVKFLQEAKRLLRQDGALIISTPDKAVYSDAPQYVNEYHRREFYVGEFRDVLRRFFKVVHFFGQAVYPVSYIWDLDEGSRKSNEFQIAYADGSFRPVFDDRKEPRYILAYCSDADLQDLGNSMLVDPTDRLVHALREQIYSRDLAIQALQARVLEYAAIGQPQDRRDGLGIQCCGSEPVLISLRQDIEMLSAKVDAFHGALSSNECLLSDRAGELAKISKSQAECERMIYETRDAILYDRLVQSIRRVVSVVLPRNATVLVASRGDQNLLALEGMNAWHFPQDDGGIYAGRNPAGSEEAIAQLKQLRRRGAEFLLVPATAVWWLNYYETLNAWLRRLRVPVFEDNDTCIIFPLPEDD